MVVAGSPGVAGPPVVEPVEPAVEPVGPPVPPEPFKNGGAIGGLLCDADPLVIPADEKPPVGPLMGAWSLEDGSEVVWLPEATDPLVGPLN